MMTTSSSSTTSMLLSVSPSVRRPRANTIADAQPSRALDKSNTSRDNTSGSFVTKLFKMVDSEPASIVTWIRGGTAFCIVDPKQMAEHCLPKYFRHRRFSSLIRQLNFYSFYRVQEGQLTIYQHSFFRKGRPDLLVQIKRRGAGKAKDPWFDPLNGSAKPPMPMPRSSSSLMGSHIHAMEPHSDMSMVRSNGMLCYSPMSKPLASSIDNMSPALKPGMAHAMPPIVELGGGGTRMRDNAKFVEDQRWESHVLDFMDHKADFNGGMLIKPEQNFAGELSSLVATSGVMTMKTNSSSVVDIDIQDFLTDDCAINAVLSEKEDRNGGTPFFGNSVVPARRALVARDCLKWGESKADDMNQSQSQSLSHSHSHSHSHSQSQSQTQHQEHGDDDAAFEQELLLDLANVEPGAWEMPLSPLADEEDVMPWLDLCF